MKPKLQTQNKKESKEKLIHLNKEGAIINKNGIKEI